MRFLILLAALALGACDHGIQTTSGAQYLANYQPKATTTKATTTRATSKTRAKAPALDPFIHEAANVEPTLRFPARLGLARIENGRLTGIPDSEAMLWQNLARQHGGLGTFHAVDPLLAQYTARSLGMQGLDRWSPDIGRIVETIRVGAARQHLDAVLIYEVGARSDTENTFLALADLTIIGGAILPTRSIEVEGVARALLLDVRNGYPYGRASTSVDLSELSPSWGSDARARDLRAEATLKVTGDLIPEVEAMFTKLVLALR